MIIDKIENALKQHFQKTIKLSINGTNVFKTGRFVLSKINAFSFDLYIKTSKPSIEILPIPIPFDIFITDNGIIFDYSVDKIAVKNTQPYHELMFYIGKNKTSKYLNEKLVISFE